MTDFLMLILVGLALFLIGLAFKLYPPKNINPWAGFRTRLAMSSQVLWDEANRYAALLYMKIGLLSIALGAIFFVLGLAEYFWVVYAVTILFSLVSILYVDRHLRKFQKGIK
jgi:uncharacterized membrane protein